MAKIDYLLDYLVKEDNENSIFLKRLDNKFDSLRAILNKRAPKEINSEFLTVQDEYLKKVNESRGIKDINTIPFDKSIISIYKGDITLLNADAIVNAGNNRMLGCFTPMHNCLDNIIHTYSGVELRLECNNILKGSTVENGNCIITKGYNLPAKYVIHTVGPCIYGMVSKKDKEELRNCYINILEIAKKNNIRTIAFPTISTGVFKFPKDLACQIALGSVSEYLKDNLKYFDKIIFCIYDDMQLEIYKNEIINI